MTGRKTGSASRGVLEERRVAGARLVVTWRVEQGGGGVERQLARVEIGQAVRINEVGGRHGAAGHAVNPVEHLGGRGGGPVQPFERAYIGLSATEKARKLLLRKPFFPAPSGELHVVASPDAPDGGASKHHYCDGLYFLASYKELAGDDYNPMPYCLLVMRPENRLRELRKKAGLTQAELAEQTGVSQSAISQLENGSPSFDLQWMRAFARVLGCTPADLLDPQDNPDRLKEDEREWVDVYRTADERERETLQRVSAAVVGYRSPSAKDEAA